MAIGDWRTNADMMADVAQLGYLNGRVLDLTANTQKFWAKFRPSDLTTNDIDHAFDTDAHFDACHTAWGTGDFDSVVFDPPYKLEGTSHTPSMEVNYGLGVPRTREQFRQLLIDGITEGARLTRHYLLVKTMDMVNSGKVRWQTDDATQAAEDAGMDKVDALLFRSYRPQPDRGQQHARRNYSTLLVFSK